MPTPKLLSILHTRCRGGCPQPQMRVRTRASTRGFTLVELLVVLVIIMILTGMVLAAAGYVSKKGGRTRAEAEMAALTAALESYKGDNGNYPRDTSTGNSITDSLEANKIEAGDPTRYAAASQFLYGQLSGDYDNSNPNASTNYNYAVDTNEAANRVYFNFPPGMLSIITTTTGKAPIKGGGGPPPKAGTVVNFIRDPFGYPYGYSTAGQQGDSNKGYNPTYDFWTTGGTVCESADTGCKAAGGKILDKSQWITNW